MKTYRLPSKVIHHLRAPSNLIRRLLTAMRGLLSELTGLFSRLARLIGVKWASVRRGRVLGALARTRQPVTLFLAPDAGLKPFFASHVILARTLMEAGRPAVILSCKGLLPSCSVKFAMQIGSTEANDTNNSACSECRVVASNVIYDYGLINVGLEELLDEADRTQIANLISTARETPWSIVFDDIEFGALCLAETMRAQRRHAISELEAEDVKLLTALAYSALTVYIAIKKFAARYNLARIAYFGDYAYYIPAQIFAARNRISLVNVSHAYNRDIDRRFISLRPRYAIAHMLEQTDEWERFSDRPLPAHVVSDIAEGALYRLTGFGGASTYSPNWTPKGGELFNELGLNPKARTLVAFPSSHDEFVCLSEQMRILGFSYGSTRQPFKSQEDWLRALVYWVSKRPDLQLVVRLHPRMGVGHRHSTLSSDYHLMKQLFVELPSNVVIVWPESKISSYNIAEFADVALASWSSIALELARFGVPVVASFERLGQFPSGNFIAFADTVEGYFKAVQTAIDRPARLSNITEAFRWTHFLHWTPLLDVSDLVPTSDYNDVPSYRLPRNKNEILEFMEGRINIVQTKMYRLACTDEAYAAETQAVLHAMKRVVCFLIGGKDVAAKVTNRRPDGHQVEVLVEADGTAIVIDGKMRLRGRSVLVCRLAMLIAQADEELSPVVSPGEVPGALVAQRGSV
jgi:hypothetical protein